MITEKLTKREILWGAFYLVFSLLLLPIVLVLGNHLLPTPLEDAYVNLIFFLLNFAAVCCIFSRHLKGAVENFIPHWRQILISAVTGLFAYLFCSTVLGTVIQFLCPDFINLNDASIQAQTETNFWAMTLGTVLLVPLAEECFHRVLVFGTLWHKRPVLGYTVSTVLFCLIHIAGYITLYEPMMLLISFIQYVPAGLCLAWTYRRANNIFAPILVHTAVNAIGMLSMR